jgi:hypothetical protein
MLRTGHCISESGSGDVDLGQTDIRHGQHKTMNQQKITGTSPWERDAGELGEAHPDIRWRQLIVKVIRLSEPFLESSVVKTTSVPGGT